MDRDTVVKLATQVADSYQMPSIASGIYLDLVCDVATLVRNAALEEAAKIARTEWETMTETECAHYRLSESPFKPEAFGFNEGELVKHKQISDAISALKE